MAEEKKNSPKENVEVVESVEEQADAAREFEENPYQIDNKKPEDIVRLFYIHNVPIIPVISKRGLLIGVLRKEDLISELSDIERNEKIKIDEFITKLARKMTLDELLTYGKVKEFMVINIFGDILGHWTRLQLFNASEPGSKVDKTKEDVDAQREEQVMEWIIYLILEHIPRPLYAVNEKGKTIFYNSLFEDIYTKQKNEEVDTGKVEKYFSNPDDNELFSNPEKESLYFYNRELDILYEKIPMISNRKKVGFLIYCDKKKEGEGDAGVYINGIDVRDMALSDTMAGVERQLIVNALKMSKNSAEAAEKLKISKQALVTKIKKHKIDEKIEGI